LQVGDRVLEIEGKKIADFDALRTRIGELAPNAKVSMVLERSGKRQTVMVTLAERPDPDSLARMDPFANPSPNKPSPAPTPAPTPAPKQGGDLYDGNPPRLGVEVRETTNGVLIERVVEGGIGHRLGLRSGDVIEQVNGEAISSIAEIVGALERDRSKAEVTVKRGDGRHVAEITEG
jgi:serine protease Do